MNKLSEIEIQKAIASLNGWKLKKRNNKKLCFKNFKKH